MVMKYSCVLFVCISAYSFSSVLQDNMGWLTLKKYIATLPKQILCELLLISSLPNNKIIHFERSSKKKSSGQ